MYAFVLMPFDKSFNDIYKLGIQDAAKHVSIKAERLDEQIFDTDMLQKIYTEIDKADIIIADMSTRNPNVFYEVGYADAKKKIVILLTNNSNDIPFDLLHRPHIIYDSIEHLKNELIKKLEWVKKELNLLKCEPLITNINIIYTDIDRTTYDDTGRVNLRVEIHNRTDITIDKINSIYIYTGDGWTIIYNKENCQKTKSEITPFSDRHIIHQSFNAIPSNDWLPIDIELRKRLYVSWDKGKERKDNYSLEGNIKISINTDKNKFISEHRIKTDVAYCEVPF